MDWVRLGCLLIAFANCYMLGRLGRLGEFWAMPLALLHIIYLLQA